MRSLDDGYEVLVSDAYMAGEDAQGDDIVPIPGTGKVHRLEENLAAADMVLTREELAAIESAMPRGAAAGDRYDAAGKAMIGL